MKNKTPIGKTKRLFTPTQVAEMLQLNVITVYNYIRDKKITAVKFGRSYRVEEKDLARFIKKSKQ